MDPHGRLSPQKIAAIAAIALSRANRPARGNPLVVALELGFTLLPREPSLQPETEQTTATRIVFAAVADPLEHAGRVRLAIAKGLLLREQLVHDLADVRALARHLAPDT